MPTERETLLGNRSGGRCPPYAETYQARRLDNRQKFSFQLVKHRLWDFRPCGTCLTTNMKRLTLVRHGETTGQSSIRYYGITDVPLSELGRAQMRCVGDALRAHRFDAVFTSRLRRSVEAAALIAGEGTPARALAAFDEVNFGRWEGWTREEIAARDPDHYAAWQRDGARFCYPGGEYRAAFHDRVAAGLAALLREEPGTHWLLVLHKGVIAVILTELLALSPQERGDLTIDLGSIHVLTQSQTGWQPDAINVTAHLPCVQP